MTPSLWWKQFARKTECPHSKERLIIVASKCVSLCRHKFFVGECWVIMPEASTAGRHASETHSPFSLHRLTSHHYFRLWSFPLGTTQTEAMAKTVYSRKPPHPSRDRCYIAVRQRGRSHADPLYCVRPQVAQVWQFHSMLDLSEQILRLT